MRALTGALVAGALLAGCGGSTPVANLAASDAFQLHHDVEAIRSAAAAHDPAVAHAATAKLRSAITDLRASGRLSAQDSRTMLAVVAQADARITNEVHAPSNPVPSVASPPAAPVKPPGRGKGHDHKHRGGDGGD